MTETTDAITDAELDQIGRDFSGSKTMLIGSPGRNYPAILRLIAAYRESQAEVQRLRAELGAMEKLKDDYIRDFKHREGR